MQKSDILITAATGNVGSPLVRSLLKKHIHFTVGTRNSIAAKEKFNSALNTVFLDFKDVASFVPALAEKDMLFLCGPSATPGAEDLLMPLVEEAKNQNIKHVVFIASYPKVMKAIEQSGMDYTFIKANFLCRILKCIRLKTFVTKIKYFYR